MESTHPSKLICDFQNYFHSFSDMAIIYHPKGEDEGNLDGCLLKCVTIIKALKIFGKTIGVNGNVTLYCYHDSMDVKL